jgi:hypothetical protein
VLKHRHDVEHAKLATGLDRGELQGVRVGKRRVRIRQSELDRFPASGTTTVPEGDEHQPSSSADHWASLGAALSASSDALAERDHQELRKSLADLSEAAARLASALGEPSVN